MKLQAIYEPKGRAAEYAKWAVNLRRARGLPWARVVSGNEDARPAPSIALREGDTATATAGGHFGGAVLALAPIVAGDVPPRPSSAVKLHERLTAPTRAEDKRIDLSGSLATTRLSVAQLVPRKGDNLQVLRAVVQFVAVYVMHQFGAFQSTKQPRGRSFMQAIYKPTGRAREYAEWAVNLYSSCTHRCVYCYAPAVLHVDREAFGAECVERPGILSKLRHDAELLAGSTEPVLLCFSCDPYQPGATITREALSILREFDVPFTVLTKGYMAWKDFDLYTPGRDSFGVSLTLLMEADSAKWEPHADWPSHRAFALTQARGMGIRTWVSLEPVIDPAQTLRLIDLTHSYVDHYKVGKLNYHPHAATTDWLKFRVDVTALLDSYGCDYYIKQDLREAQ